MSVTLLRMRRIIVIIITCTCNGSPWFSWYISAKVWHAAAFSCNGSARGICADAYIYLVKISQLEMKLEMDRAEAEERLEAQRIEYESKVEELETTLQERRREEELVVLEEKEGRITQLEEQLRQKAKAQERIEQQKTEYESKL